jgi:hypothetical protein
VYTEIQGNGERDIIMGDKLKRIRVGIDVPGRGKEAHEYEYCPIHAAFNFGERCPLGAEICKYGLTDIAPPQTCPMKLNAVLMEFSIVDGER